MSLVDRVAWPARLTTLMAMIARTDCVDPSALPHHYWLHAGDPDRHDRPRRFQGVGRFAARRARGNRLSRRRVLSCADVS